MHFVDTNSSAYVGTVEGVAAENREKPCAARLSNALDVSSDYLLGLDDRQFLEVKGLSKNEISHIQQIINDIRNKS